MSPHVRPSPKSRIPSQELLGGGPALAAVVNYASEIVVTANHLAGSVLLGIVPAFDLPPLFREKTLVNESVSEPDQSDEAFAASFCEHGLALPDDTTAKIRQFARLLWEWNQKMNLTRHMDAATFVSRDVVDAMMVAKHLQEGQLVLDVGTGGGLPGILLKILRPKVRVDLAESVGKKAGAVTHMIKELRLPIRVHQERGEVIVKKHRYEAVVVRAVAPLEDLLKWFAPVAKRFGRMLVIKGPRWVAEKNAAEEQGLLKGLDLTLIDSWPLPGTESQSVLLEIKAQGQGHK